MDELHKPQALASIAKHAKIEPYRAGRWFYGQTKLRREELARLIPALKRSGLRIERLIERAEQELKS